jgi:hypothetical protein
MFETGTGCVAKLSTRQPVVNLTERPETPKYRSSIKSWRNKMLKTILLPLSLTFSSVSFAACLPDSAEIGDVGPDSEIVCTGLEARFPQSDFVVVDRNIHSPNNVSVIVTVDGQSGSLEYKLIGSDWKLTEPAFAGRY